MLAALGPRVAAARPRYGGTLRVGLRTVVKTLDPADWPADAQEAAAKERLAGLVFEPLVRVDDKGRPRPFLARSWQSEAGGKRWTLRLRPRVKFHDGSPLSSDAVAASLAAAAGPWQVVATGDGITIESERPLSGLLLELAAARRAIVLRASDGTLSGTGPFRLVQWEPGRRVVLSANEDYWAGRPFLDRVAIEMGRPPQELLLDLELGKAEVAEISPGDARRVTQAGAKLWSSAPRVLMALVFARGRPAAEEIRLREALALSIDRAAIHNVLLQKLGEPAGALLPQWLSGYAFLFPVTRDLGRARQLVTGQPALVLAHGGADALERAVAERVAVNAREAGIRVQVFPAPAGGADLRLVRARIHSPEPAGALAELAAALNLTSPAPAALEELYAAERALVEDYRVVPLVHLPELYAASARVKSWNNPGALKDWRFEDAWLEAEKQ